MSYETRIEFVGRGKTAAVSVIIYDYKQDSYDCNVFDMVFKFPLNLYYLRKHTSINCIAWFIGHRVDSHYLR